jgi:hypothetical protein
VLPLVLGRNGGGLDDSIELERAGGGTRTHDPRFTRALLYQLSYSGTAGMVLGLVQDFPCLLVRDDLALDPLERIVDRLAVAAELHGHLLVGETFQVAAQRIGLEP